MKLRVITAIVALVIVLPILFWGGVPGVAVLCVAAASLGIWEYGQLRTPPARTGTRVFAIALAALPIIAAALPPLKPVGAVSEMQHLLHGSPAYTIAPPFGGDWVVLALGIVFLAIPISYIFRPKQIDAIPDRMSSTLFGVIYLGFTLSFCVALRALPNGLLWIVIGLATVWLGDTGAYVGGRAIGKHKMAPAISPKKTWEGLACGLVVSLAAGFGCRAVFEHWKWWQGMRLTTVHVVLVSLLSGGMGVLGDLAESLLKRAAGVKDSGTMFPGHGGMLDRIDALLFALPSVYFYAKFLFGRF